MASSALLSQIQSGRALKKAVTNDRSGPKVEGVKPNAGGGGGGGGGGIGSALSNGSSSAAGRGGAGAGARSGPPALGGLFAGGMPKLKSPSGNSQAPPTSLAKVPTIPKGSKVNGSAPAAPVRSSAPSHAPPAPPPPPPSGPPSTISRAVPPPPSRTAPASGPGRAVPPPPASPATPTITRAVPPPPTRSTTSHAPPAAPGLPARTHHAPSTAPPPSSSGRAVPPPPSRHLPPATPSSTTVEAPNSAIHSIYGRTPTSATGRDSPVSTPVRSVPPPPSSSGRKVPPPPPPRGSANAGSMSDTGATPRRLAPPPPPTRPLSAAGAPSSPPFRTVPPPRHAPPPIRTAPRVQSAISPTSGVSDAELENAIVGRMSQDGIGMGPPPPLPGGRRAPTSGGAPVLPALDLGGHGRTGSWSRAGSGAPPRSSSYGGANARSAMADSGSSKRIPSPPPMSGQYRFPASNDFPAPRAFHKAPKNYPSGRSNGTDFDLRTIG